MRLLLLLPFVAALCSVLLAFASLVPRKPTPAGWCFFAGMIALATDSWLSGLSLRASLPGEVVYWLTQTFTAKAVIPVIWLGFSLTYSRGDYRTSLARWKIPLAMFAFLPIGLAVGFREQLFELSVAETPGVAWELNVGEAARILNIILLVGFVLILTNLEQTFRSAIGTMRWRIKFVVLALAVIFGARVYVRSQAILFSVPDIAMWEIESGALLIGCVFLAVAYVRTGFAEIDVYPSLAVIRTSLTVLLVGAYLLIVGVAAQVVSRFGGEEIFRFQALVALVGFAGLAVLLFSDRARQRIHVFAGRHFSKAQHDSVWIWTLFSRRFATVKDEADLWTVAARSISESFEVLSVTIWLLDAGSGRLVKAASTERSPREAGGGGHNASGDVVVRLQGKSLPFDLESVNEAWAEELRRLNPTTFPNGGNRLCVPLPAGEDSLGAIVLADRVNGAVYTAEELELLKCIAAQATSVLLNLRLATEVARARELEAFRTMSAFFVHDLKNAATSLNLTLENLPVHFDDPAFREDALRGIANTARRIDEIIGRLSSLRNRPGVVLEPADLNQLVTEALEEIGDMPDVQLLRELEPLPRIAVDREQIQSVVTNLVLNARDALGTGGRIEVRTEQQEGRVLLSVSDTGCGMSPAFVSDSLFRPFQSTKKNGLGLGLFQSRSIVESHGGGMSVESEQGKGTIIQVSLPVKQEK